MEDYLAQPTEDGQDPKAPLQAVAHVLPKSSFLRNIGMESTQMKKNAKAAAMSKHVEELEGELQAEKKGSTGLRSQVADLERKVEDQNETARKNKEETEKLKQQGNQIQSILRSLFGSNLSNLGSR
jgi:TolA-binding protein